MPQTLKSDADHGLWPPLSAAETAGWTLHKLPMLFHVFLEFVDAKC